jgi:hypothetical protein
MKARILINKQEEMRERERERERSSEEERETRRRENRRERIEADDARVAVCPGGYQYQNIPGKPSTRLRLRIPVGSLHHPLSTGVERVPCLEGNNRRPRVRFL